MPVPANPRAMALNGAVVDLDGTVYRGDSLVDGARAGLERLRSAGLSLLFVSNNPTRSGDDYVERLTSFGLDARAGEALSAGDLTVNYLRENYDGSEVFLVGAPGLRDQMVEAGLSLTEDPEATDVLVGSWTEDFDYGDMDAALQAVDDDTVFLGTDPDRTFPREDGRVEPGSGAVIGALAATVGRDPEEMLGKPSRNAARQVTDRLGVEPEECLVVGDRPSTDLAMGEQAGMTTVLVLSGVTDRGALAESDIDPDYVIDTLGAIDRVLADLTG